MKVPMKNHFAAVFFGFVFFLVGSVMIVGSWKVYDRDMWIAHYGSHAVGHVIDKTIVHSAAPDSGGDDFMLKYWFNLPNGSRFEVDSIVTKNYWINTATGNTIEIDFDPNHPSNNFPKGEGMTSVGLALFISVLGFLFAISGIALLIGGRRQGKHHTEK
jgi:hypothetical protein